MENVAAVLVVGITIGLGASCLVVLGWCWSYDCMTHTDSTSAAQDAREHASYQNFTLPDGTIVFQRCVPAFVTHQSPLICETKKVLS